MKKRYVTLSFKKMGYNDFLDKVREIQSFLSAPMFSTIVPTPAEVIPLLDQLQVVWIQTKAGNRLLRGERDDLRELITNLLERQALAVNYLADGSMNILLNCGFDISKEEEPRPVPETVMIKAIEPLQAGEVIIKIKTDPFAEYYQAKITGPNGFTKWYTSLHPKMKVPDLLMGVTLTVVVRSVNNKGIGQWSVSGNFVLPTNTDPNVAGEE